jgi:hypothetical protein
MFGDLPKLFDRNFAIAFLLPVVMFLFVSSFLGPSFGIFGESGKTLETLSKNQPILGVSAFVFMLWIGGILLLALSRSIIRLKEGYGRWNPARIFVFIERRKFRRLQDLLATVESEIDFLESRQQRPDPSAIKKQTELRQLLASRFPQSEQYLLPTAFGNTIRAFEAYSLVMYGLDAIPSWPRLLTVIPDNDRDLVDSAKAQASFWVNVWLLSLLVLLEYLVLAVIERRSGSLWFLTSLPIAWWASNRARNAAASWGEMVKAAFDVYLPQLGKKLGLDMGKTRDEERAVWSAFSVAILYRYPEILPSRVVKPETEAHGQP